MKSYLSFMLVVMFVFMFSNCATIIHGSKQSVSISSNPTKALVTIDGKEEGRTPVTLDLSRRDHHTVQINLDGYMPYETKFTRKVDGWIAGNIVFGGLIGLAIDGISGGMYKLTPDQIQADLKSGNVAMINSDKGLYLTVVLNPDPKWEKIGQLEKLN
ncbi:MAG: PEGA domain-containing protein [Methylococcaceae bacterium]|nr:PEGA domain-containing protein [Prolixibacteraceae bacterium]